MGFQASKQLQMYWTNSDFKEKVFPVSSEEHWPHFTLASYHSL